MPRTEEAEMWYSVVYKAVQEIPYGKVTSYGHIATLVGYPAKVGTTWHKTILDKCMQLNVDRQVGVCLKYLPSASDQPDARYNSDTVPWQRVINSKGTISNRGAGGAARQETAIAQEGVDVGRGSLGERTIDFSTFGWFPDRLPSEEAEDEED